MGDAHDWTQISLLYGSLWVHEPTPVIALNWAVAIAEIGQPEQALTNIEALENDLKEFQPFYAAYAEILRQLGQFDMAKTKYEIAIKLSQNGASKKFLEKRLSELK